MRRGQIFLRLTRNVANLVCYTQQSSETVRRRRLLFYVLGRTRSESLRSLGGGVFSKFCSFQNASAETWKQLWWYSRSGKKCQTLNNLQVAVKHTCIKRCKAKKYWGRNYTLDPVPWEVLGRMTHCPYGVGARAGQTTAANFLFISAYNAVQLLGFWLLCTTVLL